MPIQASFCKGGLDEQQPCPNSKMPKTALILFSLDLRESNNPAFFYAAKNCQEILPLFIFDEKNLRKNGQASKWFLHHVLEDFSKNLAEKFHLKLLQKKGDSLEILAQIFAAKKIDEIYFNNQLEPDAAKLQLAVKNLAEKNSVTVFSFDSQTLFHPSEINTGTKTPFKVFTPFWKECLRNVKKIAAPLPAPNTALVQLEHNFKSDDLKLLPQKNWAKKFEGIWQFDAKKIRKNLSQFLDEKISNYKAARDFPSIEGTSQISPYLHFGVISIQEIFFAALQKTPSAGLTQFLAELGWREFCHHLLFHFPNLPTKNFQQKFDKFPWLDDANAAPLLQKWQMGKTGFPIVDAGMRELWATGFMHNRVRMIVASFLVKDLLVDWKKGEEWFWDCLLDANLANNVANWQWVAGSGADAAPYFRIFNPTLQGERFDEEGIYVKKWLPELKKLPKKFIHAPWLADEKTLEFCGVELGKTYPKPMLDHAKAREMALLIYKNLR